MNQSKNSWLAKKLDLAEVVLARLLAVDSLPMCKFGKSKESENSGVSKTQDSNQKKSHEKDFSFTDKIKANLKQKLALRISKKIDRLIFARRYFARKQINSLCE